MFDFFSKFSLARLRQLFNEQSELKRRAVLAAMWSLGSYGISVGLRVGSSLIMTRLLFPELFGLMSLVYVILTGLHLFSDVGSAPTVIRSERGEDPELLNNVWTVQVIRGVILWFCCLILASPASHFYNEPRLLWLLPIVGLACISGGFYSTSIFTLTRRLEMGRWSQFELKNQIISTVLMIVIAWFHRDIWALVVSYLIADVIRCIWSHFLIPNYHNHFAWNWQIIKDMSSFGRWILLSTMMTFAAAQVDRVLVGKLLSWHFLGVYGVVLAISELPRSIIEKIADQVLFPAAYQLVELPRDTLRQKILHNRRPVLMVIAIGLSLLVCFGDEVISIMYDKRYADGTWMLPLIAIGIWPNVLFQTLYPILLALSKPQYQTWGNFGKFLFTCVGLPLAFVHFGEVGVVIAVALNDLPLYSSISFGLWREKLTGIQQDISMTGLFLSLVIGLLSLRYVLGFGLPIDHLWSPS